MKIRVMASHGPIGRGGLPALVYRAEAYDEADRYRECKWGCSHSHDSVERAFNCGMGWLDDQTDEAVTETA